MDLCWTKLFWLRRLYPFITRIARTGPGLYNIQLWAESEGGRTNNFHQSRDSCYGGYGEGGNINKHPGWQLQLSFFESIAKSEISRSRQTVTAECRLQKGFALFTLQLVDDWYSDSCLATIERNTTLKCDRNSCILILIWRQPHFNNRQRWTKTCCSNFNKSKSKNLAYLSIFSFHRSRRQTIPLSRAGTIRSSLWTLSSCLPSTDSEIKLFWHEKDATSLNKNEGLPQTFMTQEFLFNRKVLGLKVLTVQELWMSWKEARRRTHFVKCIFQYYPE